MSIPGRVRRLLPVAFAVAFAVLPASCHSAPSGSKTDAGIDVRSVDLAADTPADTGRDSVPDARPSVVPDGSADARPDPLPGSHWVTVPAPLAVPITALAFDSEGVLYAGAAGEGGIFKSADEGTSWNAASLGLIDYSVVSLAAVGTTMYAGTPGLMRSTDRGASWQQVVVPDDGEPFQRISGEGDLVVAGNSGGNPLYLSTDTGRTFHALASPPGGLGSLEVLGGGSVILRAGPRGVFRSTDQGVTFSPVQGITNGMYLYAELRCDGVRTCYANGFDTPNPSDATVLFKSTDAGATWTPLPLMGWDVLAISDRGSVYLQATTVVRSDDGGSTFTPIACPTTVGASGPDCSGSQVTGPYVARGDKLFAGRVDGVYRSDDKGQHWQPASGSPATGAIAGAAVWLFVDVSPTALGPSGDIYVNGFDHLDPVAGAVYTLKRSRDDGRTWQALASPFGAGPCIVTPSGALECQGVSVAGLDLQTVGRSDDHGATWRNVNVPPGLGSVNTSPVLATIGSVVYVSGGSGLARSIDDGLTFELIPNGPSVGSLQVLHNGHLLVTDATSGADAGYRSTDQGASWQPIQNLTTLPVVEDASGRLIRYTASGSIEVSTDEAGTWTRLASSDVPQPPVNFVPLTADGAGHLFLFGRYSFDEPVRVFASADGGAQFLPMSAQIPNPNALSFATDKQGRLLVGTSGGVFRLESRSNPTNN